jgi:hypothetical protein
MPGLLNLATQPCLTGVSPRCIASNGLSSLKISVYGMYIQDGKITARHGGRYLQTTWVVVLLQLALAVFLLFWPSTGQRVSSF